MKRIATMIVAAVVAIAAAAVVKPLDDKTSGKLLGEATRTWVVDFSASWCGPCRVFAPTYEQLSNELRGVDFYKVDIDASPVLARRYRIQAVPTVYIHNPATGRTRVIEGVTSADALRQAIDSVK